MWGKKWKKIIREGKNEDLLMYESIVAKRNHEEASGSKVSKKRRVDSDNDKNKVYVLVEAVKQPRQSQ